MRGWTEKKKEKEEEKKKKEKVLLCESIGHRRLWGRCPKGVGGLTNSPTDQCMDGRTDGRTDSQSTE